MSKYWFETGICLCALWFAIILLILVTWGIYEGCWPLVVLYPPLGFLFILWVDLWKTRPSVNNI